jgi:hypothetical protein
MVGAIASLMAKGLVVSRRKRIADIREVSVAWLARRDCCFARLMRKPSRAS